MGSWGKKSSFAIACFALACSSTKATTPGVTLPDQSADAPTYAFDSLDARPVTSTAFAGKPAVITFITTYDPVSQMQVNFLVDVASDTPSVQFALVALQDAAQRELVELYRDAMKVKFPVAIGDTATTAGGGTLGDVHQVPTTIVLGRDGRIVWRKSGGVTKSELAAHLRGL